jgi:ribosome-associated protein
MSNNLQRNFPLGSTAVTNSAIDTSPIDDGSEKLAFTAAEAASERKAGDIVLLKVANVSYLADYFVLMTGYSRVQVRAIADSVEKQIEEGLHRCPLRTEGKNDGSWVLYDYGDVIVHVMMPKERDYYNLEAFWGHAERIEFTSTFVGEE